ncbi:cytochrome c3 family protein [Erythrobacter sp. THAF29]|uniref:cytochrome c3 family protein n=1 Tax=Erythrobacter sp. THAF29 TaxID=2587851 RepID=UPI0012689408|nr:cytochrome c3 family protein [Erythrobacter sp. THAF29]QFT78674.1 Doubled CXXCH motif protein [Erythrobacter sp. THAF29]
MAFLIRTIDYTSSGREIVRERTLDQPDLTIGRASENDIHLPDLAVEQHHAKIHEAPDGTLIVEALSTLGFEIDGKSETKAEIAPNLGGEIEIGSSRLTIARDGDGVTSITIRQVDKSSPRDVLRGFALSSALPSKRAVSWVLASAILIALLAVPIVTHLTRDPVEIDPDGDMPDQVLLDSAWSSGELSMKHHALEDNCEACHVTPFVSVQDETCLTCHEGLGEHAARPRLAAGLPSFSEGDAIQWSIAQTLGKEGPLGCVACHTEHEGPVRQAPASEQFCADCHSDLDTRLSDTQLANAHDFGKQHPQFRPTFYASLGADEPVRMSLDTPLIEASGLKFPHNVHMDPQGGAARMALSLPGYGAPLECSDCHEETDDRIGFKPVVMESACESCHSLISGRSSAGFTKLRHGDIDDLRADLARVNRGQRRAMIPGRTRPGQFAQGGRYYSNFGRPFGAYLSISNALGANGVCAECHLPTRTDGMPDVMPVNLPDRFLLHGYFDHAAHEDETCTSCHAAETSSEASDLLIPDLASCRDCHLGATAAKTEEIVPSSCAMCHGYHTPTKPWSPGHPDTPRETPATIAATLERMRR